MTLTVCAPAKINLDLRVFGRRPDRFHEVRTLLQSIHLHDTLSFRRWSGPMIVRSRSKVVPNGQGNLVWTAACSLWSADGRRGMPTDVVINISKRIPVAAGLGGGSSDAASALRGLCELWGISPRGSLVRDVASSVGSDVPFFLEGGLAMGCGRGESVQRISETKSFWVVLAYPPFGVSTVDAYRWFDESDQRRWKLAPRSRSLPRGWRRRLEGLANDLEPAVVRRHPEIELMVERLRGTDALLASMTGSGSTVYGLFRGRSTAQAARHAIRRRGWRTVITRTVGHGEFIRMTKVATMMRRRDVNR